MISFRYHLVSLTAVLLALAAGVVLGAGPLDGRLGGTTSSSGTKKDVAALDKQVADLQGRVAYDDAAAAALAPSVLAKQLAGKTVVVVVTPGTESAQVAALAAALHTAGATITGQVAIQPAWVDGKQSAVLGSLAEQLAPPDVALPSGGAYTAAGAALAAALVTDAAAPLTVPDETSVALLTGFEEGGFITVTGTPAVPAQLALVVSPAGPAVPTDAATASNEALLPLVAALDTGQGAVLAGAEGSARPGGLVGAVRDSGPVRRQVSTDDIADAASGVIASVLALVQQAGGTTGHYGIGPGADAAMPPVGHHKG